MLTLYVACKFEKSERGFLCILNKVSSQYCGICRPKCNAIVEYVKLNIYVKQLIFKNICKNDALLKRNILFNRNSKLYVAMTLFTGTVS